MISKETKIFQVNGKKMQFDFLVFTREFQRHRKAEGLKVSQLEEIIADAVSVSVEAVHNWRFRSNGPSDLQTIKDIAKELNISQWELLLKEVTEDTNMVKLTTQQQESLKRVYDSIINFLHIFENTDGFTGNLWYRFAEQGSKDPEEDIQEYADKEYYKVELVIKKEYFYLHDTAVYDEIYDYFYNDLLDTYDGKLGYAYRFEAIPDGNPTTSEDYEKALKRINEIIEKYV